MHSLNHPSYGHAVAAARVEAASGRRRAGRFRHPPPLARSRAAYAAATVARKLDPAAARRAVA